MKVKVKGSKKGSWSGAWQWNRRAEGQHAVLPRVTNNLECTYDMRTYSHVCCTCRSLNLQMYIYAHICTYTCACVLHIEMLDLHMTSQWPAYAHIYILCQPCDYLITTQQEVCIYVSVLLNVCKCTLYEQVMTRTINNPMPGVLHTKSIANQKSGSRCLVFTCAYLSKATGGNCDRTTITTTMCFSPFTPYPGNLLAHKLKPAKHSNNLHRRAHWSKSTKCVPCVPLAKPQSTTGKTKTGNARYCCQRCACMQNGSIKIQQQNKMSNKAVNRQK